MLESSNYYAEENKIVEGQTPDSTPTQEEPRPRLSEERYRELASAVDEETFVLSGGFNSTSSYLDLLTRGSEVVPMLIEDLKQSGNWWRIQMVSYFASVVFELPIDFPEEILGQLDPVNDRVQKWWTEVGQQHFGSIEPKPLSDELPQLP